MTNKEIAVTFLRLTSSGKVDEAYEKYIASNFRHHNPYFHGDAKSLAVGMKENAAKNPNKIFEVKHVLEDEDLVAVHSRVRLKPDGADMAVVHIFRFENNRIIELWDFGQQWPDDSPNKNGIF